MNTRFWAFFPFKKHIKVTGIALLQAMLLLIQTNILMRKGPDFSFINKPQVGLEIAI